MANGLVEIFKMWYFIIFHDKIIIYRKYWCANVEKDFYRQQYLKKILFSTFSPWEYFLEKSLVRFCFTSKKNSCSIYVKISISELRAIFPELVV